LVLDRYDTTLVLKLYTAAWFPWLDQTVRIIKERLRPERIVLRLSRNIQKSSETHFAKKDGEILSGTPPTGPLIFLESGLPGEKSLPGQNPAKYDGQSRSFADRTVARYNGKTHMIFGDGHAELLEAKDVVNSNGLAYFPQIGENGGKVAWTLDPDADAN
jgi:prepilin-type processing-associated H-X9-DG protein